MIGSINCRPLLRQLPTARSTGQLHAVGGEGLRQADIALSRELLVASTPTPEPIEAAEPPAQLPPCPCCGGRMRIIETFERWMQPRAPPRHPAATGRRRDPAQFIPTQCRRQSFRQTTHRAHFASPVSSGTPNPCRDRHKVRSKASDVGRERLDIFSLCASNEARRTSRPYNPAQPKHQIPISPDLHTAGSFLGDFRTPTASETLHESRTAGFGEQTARADGDTE
jgi:hypothetical protein